MSYTKEMCSYLLENKQLIEGESLTDYVEKMVFKTINTAISKRLGERTPWRTRFALVTEDEDGNDDTIFAPLDWPKKPGNGDLVMFRLWENDKDINDYWLAHALGLNDGALCFDFWMDGRPIGPSKYKVKQHMEAFLKENDALKKAGFQYHQRGTIFLPFTLDAKAVAQEFPDLKKSLEPMATALETVLKLMPEFDKFVKNLMSPAKL